MKFAERYLLKSIQVGKYELKQASASFWHTGKKTTEFPIMYITYAENTKAPWRGVIETGIETFQFNSSELDRLCSVLESIEKLHPIS